MIMRLFVNVYAPARMRECVAKKNNPAIHNKRRIGQRMRDNRLLTAKMLTFVPREIYQHDIREEMNDVQL